MPVIIDMPQLTKEKIGLWLISVPEFDAGGNWRNRIAGFTSLAPDVPVILDAIYQNWDEVYQSP